MDPAFGLLVPADIERPVFWEEVEGGIRQVFMDPACKALPGSGLMVGLPIAWHDNASGGTHEAIGVTPVPNMLCVVCFN
jgi:hypothetical protein